MQSDYKPNPDSTPRTSIFPVFKIVFFAWTGTTFVVGLIWGPEAEPLVRYLIGGFLVIYAIVGIIWLLALPALLFRIGHWVRTHADTIKAGLIGMALLLAIIGIALLPDRDHSGSYDDQDCASWEQRYGIC